MASNNNISARLHIHFGLVAAAFLFASSLPGTQAPKMPSAAEGDIREAIVLVQMDELGGEQNYFCLSVEDEDATAQFLIRFQNGRASMQPESLCSDGPKSNRRRVDLWQGTIQWTGRNSARVAGGYHCGMLCAAKGTFVMKRKKGQWKVMKFIASWYS
jgi:hypothetical protein